MNLFSHVYFPILQPLPSSLHLFRILLLFSSLFLIFSPLFLYFLSSSSLPKPSTDSYNIYDCLEHTLAAENWRAYIAVFIPILTPPNSLFVVWFSFSPDRITPTLWRQWPASNSCWRKFSLDSEINFPASHVNVSLNTFYSPWIPDRRKNMTGSSAAHQCNL